MNKKLKLLKKGNKQFTLGQIILKDHGTALATEADRSITRVVCDMEKRECSRGGRSEMRSRIRNSFASDSEEVFV